VYLIFKLQVSGLYYFFTSKLDRAWYMSHLYISAVLQKRLYDVVLVVIVYSISHTTFILEYKSIRRRESIEFMTQSCFELSLLRYVYVHYISCRLTDTHYYTTTIVPFKGRVSSFFVLKAAVSSRFLISYKLLNCLLW